MSHHRRLRGLTATHDQRERGPVSDAGPSAQSPMVRTSADREFLFEYRYGGSEWGISVHAADPAEAREKIKAVGLARYKGEVAAKIPVPCGGAIRRLIDWLRN